MKHSVQVAQVIGGEPTSVRELSIENERRAVFAAAGTTAILFLIGAVAAAIAFLYLERAVFLPGFALVWAAGGALVAWRAARRAAHRASRYRLGTSLDADAFAPNTFSLIKRVGDHFALTLLPGMRGRIEAGRSPLPIEALLESGEVDRATGEQLYSLDGPVFAEITFGGSTFVVRTASVQPRRAWWPEWRVFAQPAARFAAGGLPIVLLASALFSVGAPQAIADRPYRAVTPKANTPWEAEKLLRLEAQMQARSLHQCFDPLPLSCQRPGFVGVGLSLAKDGDIRSNWIARSTYGRECPVTDCMRHVVATWSFDPLPAPMRVVLPVQVLRTEKPLPVVRAAEAAVITSPAEIVLDWSRPDERP